MRYQSSPCLSVLGSLFNWNMTLIYGFFEGLEIDMLRTPSPRKPPSRIQLRLTADPSKHAKTVKVVVEISP